MRKLLGALFLTTLACSSAQPAPRAASPVAAVTVETEEETARFEDCVEVAEVQRVLTARNVAFQDCYADGLALDPNLRGTVTLGVHIPPSGEGRVHITASTLGNASVTRCIAEVASGISFEQQSCSVAQSVEYPVRLARGSSEFASAQ
ncbi:MAG TPA: AgmX/PglI C-terminal domain-containing protein [Polyangiaceae bacterium]|nr:AgmX/PglI C-terminal domain-containing protein [Polyangiaceae bacterium]